MDLNNPMTQRIHAKLSYILYQILSLSNDEWEFFFVPNGSSANQLSVDIAQLIHGRDMSAAVLQYSHSSLFFALSRSNIAVSSITQASRAQYVSVVTGQTQTGIIESVPEETPEDTWLHIDAAYGGFKLGLLPDVYPEKQQMMQVLHDKRVSSITLDFHKFFCADTLSVLCIKKPYMDMLQNISVPYFASNIASSATTTLSASGAHQVIDLFQSTSLEFLILILFRFSFKIPLSP